MLTNFGGRCCELATNVTPNPKLTCKYRSEFLQEATRPPAESINSGKKKPSGIVPVAVFVLTDLVEAPGIDQADSASSDG